jgi:hypothetical protein
MSQDYSQKALVEFLEYAGRAGLMPKNTAQSRKTAVQKLLAVLHGEEAADLRKLNIDDVAARFANRHKTDYTQQSLRVYQSRARSAIADFIAWTNDPSSFKPSGKQGAARTKGARPSVGDNNSRAAEDLASSTRSEVSSANTGRQTFSIPIPVRDGFMVEVVGLPKDLTLNEAQKISGIVMAYATKEAK